MSDTNDEAARLRSEAARALGASSASRAGKASQAKVTPEERKRRNKAIALKRWARYHAEKDHAKASDVDKTRE
jgi:hypothetical protein